MKIVSYNLNGLRAVLRKGFREFLAAESPDVCCLQEIKIDAEALRALGDDPFPGYHAHWFPAEKKGYSGVGLLCKEAPVEVQTGVGHETYDAEGRVIQARFASGLNVINVYLPSGSQGSPRQQVKEAFMDHFYAWVQDQPGFGRSQLIAGDLNICHQPMDIHDPVRLKTVSGFLPHEREWLTKLLALGYLDSFRHLKPEAVEYSWFSYRARAKERYKGWRIDYQLVSEPLAAQLRAHDIQFDYGLSDHVPCSLQLAAS